MRHRAGILALVLILGVFPAALVPAQESEKQNTERAGDIVLSQCRVKLINHVVLASDRAGTLESVGPREGDLVEKGQPVAGLRDDVAQAALKVAEHVAENDVEVRFAEKSGEVAKAEHRKAVETNKRAAGAVPEVEILRLKLAAEKTLLQAEQAAHDFEKGKLTRDQARAELRSYRVDAPFSGIVTRVYKYAGEAVQQGDPIVELVNAERMRVEGFVNVSEVRAVAASQRVVVQLEIPGAQPTLAPDVLEGKIVFVDVSVQPVSHKVRVWAEVANRDGILRAGLTARMVIETGIASPAPATASGK